jgi:hypothetical protein
MRKHVLLFLLAVLSCSCLFAQDEDWGLDRSFRIALGPKVGAGVAVGSDSKNYNLNLGAGLGFQGGLALNAHLGRRHPASEGGTGLIGIEVEGLYGIRTIAVEGEAMGMSCLEFPVLLQIYPIPTLAIEAGATMVKGLKTVPGSLEVNNMVLGVGEMKSNDVMISFGASFNARFGLSVGLRYNLGMSNLAGNFDSKASSLMFSLAYLFKIVK